LALWFFIAGGTTQGQDERKFRYKDRNRKGVFMRIGSVKLRTAAKLSAAVLSLWMGIFSANGVLYHWYSIGPQPITSLDKSNNITGQDIGRVTTLAVDPSGSVHWLIGAAQGGIWETFDAGQTFIPRTDSQASMAMGAIAFAPGNPSRVLAGTGEQNFRGDAYAGAGLLLSQSGGGGWGMLNTSFARMSFSHINIDPLNFSNVVVATVRGGGGVGQESSGYGNVPGAGPRGVYTSTDGGTNFTLVLPGEATALAVNPLNFNEQYAGLGEIYGGSTNGIYRTRNGWISSQLIAGPWATNITPIETNIPISTNIVINCSNIITCYTNIIITYSNYVIGTNYTAIPCGRIAMAISPSSPDTLYVGLSEPRTNYLASLLGIWKTTNAWADTPDWDQLPSPDLLSHDTDLPRMWYMFDLLVDAADPAKLYLAEFNVWRYDGSWIPLAWWSTNDVHPDNHVIVWWTNHMLLGNDGGVYVSDPTVSGVWTNLSPGLRITQFYKGAVGVTGEGLLALGGAQDNFTSLYKGDLAWRTVSGGDGADCAISAADPLNNWATSLQTITGDLFEPDTVGMARTLNGGKDSNSAADEIKDVLPFARQFFVHFEKAPYNDDLFIAGTAQLWRCNNFFTGTTPSWTNNSPIMLDTNSAPVPISAMAFAPSDTRGWIYAYGTEDGQLRITWNGGTNWNDLDPGGAVPERYVSGLAFSPVNTNVLYVSLSGFNGNTPGHPGHLFKTANAFALSPTWVDVSPPVDQPNNCVAIDPNNSVNLFVGADIGVWNSFDGGTTWSHFGPSDGMPNVAVFDLRYSPNGQLMAFTHGRGAYLFSRIDIPVLVSTIRDFHPTPNCLTCPPDEMWINPGDLVSVEIPLQNILPIDTVDLTATLLPSTQVAPITGVQHYGVVKGQGKAVKRVFKFIVGGGAHVAGGPAGAGDSGGSCCDTAQLVLQLQDPGVDLGQITIPFRLGVPSHPFVEDFEEETPTPLPPGWQTTSTGVGLPWTETTEEPPNMPGGGEDEKAPEEENTSVFVPDSAAGVGESFLTSPPFIVATPQAQLYFREAFMVSNTFDGCILEIAIGAQPFQEIIQAGGSFVKDGYNRVLSDFNPLGLRPAWSGNSGGWLPVVVNLPATAAGQSVRLRWHFAKSRGIPDGAWFIDSAFITEPLCLPPVSNPVILNPTLNGNLFRFSINTVTNRNYIIDYKTNLTDIVWQTLQVLPGNGSLQTISVPIELDSHRFFRFRVE
jgi:hypothetical protein